jgi:hypothetical protein
MEHEGSLPCLQEPATSPYPEPQKSSLHVPTHVPKMRHLYIHGFHNPYNIKR